MFFIFICFAFSSLFCHSNELKNTELIPIKNIEEIEKIITESNNTNYDFIFNFFLETNNVVQNSKPVQIQRAMSLSSNFSEIHIKNFNGSSIFVVDEFVSFFCIKNILFFFYLKKEKLSLVLFTKNVVKIQIESLQIIDFHSSFSIFSLENRSLRFFNNDEIFYFKIKNLTIKRSKILSLVSNSKYSYEFSKTDRTKFFKSLNQIFLIIEQIYIIDCYILKEFINSQKIINLYISNAFFIYCLFNGSIIQNKISLSSLIAKISFLLIENCKFLDQPIFYFRETEKKILLILFRLDIVNSNVDKDIIYVSMSKIAKTSITIFIIDSKFINLNFQANCFQFLRTKIYIYRTIFKSIANISIRKPKFIILRECTEFKGFMNQFNSISKFQNIIFANSKQTYLKLLFISNQFVNIPSYGSIILFLHQNKLEISLLKNFICKISILKENNVHETSFNMSNAIINLIGKYVNVIFKENQILDVQEFKNLFYFNCLQSNLLFAKNNYKDILLYASNLTSQNIFVISFISIHVSRIVSSQESFLNLSFTFSIFHLNCFMGIMSEIFFFKKGLIYDAFLILRTLMKSIDSNMIISKIHEDKLYLNFLININSYTSLSDIIIESYEDYQKGFAFFFGFASSFQIQNIIYQRGNTESYRCFFISILNSKKNQISQIKNLTISKLSMKFSIVTSYISNVEIFNIFIFEFENAKKSYSNYYSLTDINSKTILFHDFQYYKNLSDIFNFLTPFYFFSSNIIINSSNFSNLNLYETPLIKSEYSSISLENSKFEFVFCFFESILCFVNNFFILLKNNEFKNNFEHLGSIRIINEITLNNSYKFQFEGQNFNINKSLIMLYTVQLSTLENFFKIEYFRKYSNFYFKDWFESKINIVSSNNIFNFMGSGIYHISNCIFEVIPKTSTLILYDVDQILIIGCLFRTKQVFYDKPQIKYYENYFFNKSLIHVNSQLKYLRIFESLFESTFSEKGSVLYISLPETNSFQTRIEIFNCTFANNSAIQEGGVFYFVSKDLFFFIKNNLFYNNSAGSHGGVIYSESQGKIAGNTFLYNKAGISGGGIRWNKIEPIFECDDIVLDNVASYGEFIASEARYIILLNVSDYFVENKYFYDFYMKNRSRINFKAVQEEDCDKFSKDLANEYFEMKAKNKLNVLLKNDIKIVFGLYDLYYQLATVNHSFIFEIINFSPEDGIIKEKDFIKYDTYGFIILENLEFIFIKPNGVIKFFIEKVPFFDDSEAQRDSLSQKMEFMMSRCFPEIEKNNKTDYFLFENNINCRLGEYFQKSKCIKCPEDYYTLIEFNKINESNFYSKNGQAISNNLNCNKKPSLAKYAFGSVIIPFDGYWIEKGKDIIYECIYREACIYPKFEESLKENTSFYSTPFGTVCLLGFDGNFCGQCSINTDLYKEKKCVDCKELNENILFNGFNLLFLLLFYEIAIISAGRTTYLSKNKIETPLFKIFMNLILSLEILRRKIIKMDMINNLLSNSNSTLEFYYEIMQYFGSVAHPSKIVTFRCLTNYFLNPKDYPYFKLIFIILLPFFFLIFSLLLFFFVLEKKNKLSLKFFLSKTMSVISTIQFIFIYELIKILFSFLNCIPFYDDKVLKAFPDLSCSDQNYLLIRNYLVLPFLTFYVLIIPLGSYLVILRNRHNIKTDNMIKRFGFIYLGYKSNFFFWEYVIYFKKLSLIIFDVLSESEPFSIFYFLGISIIYLFYHYQLNLHKPYKSRILFDIEVLTSYLSLIILGFCVVFASFQRKRSNLVMQIGNSILDDTSNSFELAYLIITIMFFLAFIIRFAKVILSRYLCYIRGFFLNLRKKNGKMNKLNSEILKKSKFYFLKYLDFFQERKKNSIFLTNLLFQEQMNILMVKKIIKSNPFKINSAIKTISNQHFSSPTNSKKIENNGKVINKIYSKNFIFILNLQNTNFLRMKTQFFKDL